MKRLIFVLISLAACSAACAQDDSTRMADLTARGSKFERGRVVLWLSKDSLQNKRIDEILDTLNLGIEKASRFIQAPRIWQLFADKPVTFFLCNDDFVPHASGDGFVFMPLKRFNSHRALWFHEAMHILLRTKAGNWNDAPQEVTVRNMPLWLTEGLPEYIAMRLSYENNLARYDAWKDGGYMKADSACAAKLRGEKGTYILNYIGKAGVLVELFGKTRPLYAPTFYNCSCSFTKYLVDRFGIEILLQGIAAYGAEQKTIEALTSTDLEALKKAWLTQIGYILK